MFMPFTDDEIESIRSIVLIGQQNNDMLLSNCSSRPILQTKSFIQRFKRLLLDTQNTVKDITKLANEQYVAIIAGVRVKRCPKLNSIPSATSVSNLASPLLKIPRSLPHKFYSKFAKFDDEEEMLTQKTKNLPPPLPTRSRSISDGLSNYDQPSRSTISRENSSSKLSSTNSFKTTRLTKKNSTSKPITMPNIDFRNTSLNMNYHGYNQLSINSTATVNSSINFSKQKALPQPQFVSQSPTTLKQETPSKQYIRSFHNIIVAPPPLKKFPRSCNSVSELPPGTLAAMFINSYDSAYICRVLGSRNINGIDYVLISFFQDDFSQLYVLPQQLALLPSFIPSQELVIPEPLTVDSLLENIIQAAQCIVVDNEVQTGGQNLLFDQNHREILFKSLVCASYLIFIDFFSKFIVPKDKVELILNSIDLLNPPKYSTTVLINKRCRELVNKIIALIEKDPI